METKHSPGPWRVKPLRVAQVECSPFEDGTVVATCYASSFAPPVEESQANARLIAKAPDLKEMVVKLLRECREHNMEYQHCTPEPLLAEAAALLKEIDGESVD